MRRVILTTAFAISVIAAAAAESARSPGAYTSLTTANAAACARACADDGICMAWSFERDNRCDLSAVLPASLNTTALAAGIASRAPAYLQPRTPDVHVAAIEVTAAPEPQPLPAAADEAPAPEADDTALLGGPLESDLRLGLR
jgi:hypothetical protein